MLPKPAYCQPCPLAGDMRGFSNLEGTGESSLLVLAEALGEHEEEDGLPLRPHAPAGSIFQRAIREARLSRNDLLISNIIRCRPPGNELRGADYERTAINHCAHYLDHAVAQYRPKAILALGNTPMRELTDYDGILTYRGFILRSRYDVPVIGAYHPALLARGALGTLFGVFKRDVALALQVAADGPPLQLETDYVFNPSIGEVERLIDYLRANTQLPISYDVETAGILGEKEPADWALKRLVQIQFSIRAGHAIVLPWDGPYCNLARTILALPNPKWGWNSRTSDDIVLEANGCTINGERHDLYLAWQHLHPDFASQKEGTLTGTTDAKEFTARLMNLQSCASFYCPEIDPWKHLAERDLQYYGARDADITNRCGIGIFASLRKQGLYDGYYQHKFRLRKVLDDLGRRGLPIDRAKQNEVRVYAKTELHRLQSELQAMVPIELRAIHPPAGYKSLASKVSVAGQKVSLRSLVESYDPDNPPLIDYSNFSGHLVPLHYEQLNSGAKNVWAWAVRKLFNVGSSQQLLAYIKHKGYRVPKRLDDPTKDTTGKDELAKLAKETGDPVLKLTDQYRKFSKLAGSYVGKEVKRGEETIVVGDWVPGEDGRVHPEFRWGTGSGQLSCASPNAQQFPEHGPLAKRAKEMIVAEPGHTFVKIDMRGFHARMIGFLAEDEAYYKLADFDVHSYITAHYLRLHDAPYLLDMSDGELRAALKAIKAEHEHTRNFKVKRVVHGSQFGMGVNKLYNMHGPDLNPPIEVVIEAVGWAKWEGMSDEQRVKATERMGRAEAQKLLNLLRDLFPATFDSDRYSSFPARIARQIRNETKCYLKSPFGHIRWFWDYDKEKSTAYLPSNCSHCHIQYGLLILDDMGALDRYGLCNFTHDAVWYHTPDALVSECLEVTARVFERESDVLFNRWGAFQCNSDAEIGPSLAKMKGV